MLTDTELDRLFAAWKTPEAGRQLIRKLRADGPVRKLQGRMDTVRTRYISKKMGRALYAESRTVELPGIVFREKDPKTTELWPQPCTVDLFISGMKSGRSRVQHTPDLFLITDSGFVVEEWREEGRLLRLAQERPHHFVKDEEGNWHYLPAEEHFKALGIDYRLRSADEHPRIFLANLWFLEDYSLESALPVPAAETSRLLALLGERKYVPHLELIHEHHFKADHVFQLLLTEDVYVDLHATRLDVVDDLVIYCDKVVAQADALLRLATSSALPDSALVLRVGSKLLYEQRPYEVVLVGTTEIIARDSNGDVMPLPMKLATELFQRQMLTVAGGAHVEKEYDLAEVLGDSKKLAAAMERRAAVLSQCATGISKRTLRRWASRVAGVTAPQDQLRALMPSQGANRTSRLPLAVLALAERAVKEHHNKPNKPSVFATYQHFVCLCSEAGETPMRQSSFYEWIKTRQNVVMREGLRKAYQQEPIPLHFDYEHPVHGVLPHEVVYVDHTIPNVFLRGMHLEDLGKPVLSIAIDGALSMARAFYLSYRPAGTESVLMLLRDYVRRNGRLPKVLVLDNGKEFHSEAVKLFCSLFSIHIRWRRRSKPRDSTMVERALGATEQEVISALEGNSIALKDPREVSSSVNPKKFIRWTLPALHGSIEHYLFEVHSKRVHPRFGMTPGEYEKRLLLECGAREHVLVRYDKTLKLLTSPHSGKATREVDRRKGVFVDGRFYWNDKLAQATQGEAVEVRCEMWCARAVYVCFRSEWIVAQARDGGRLEGRFPPELEMQRREEHRKKRNEAQKDKRAVGTARKKNLLWEPEVWDRRLREQAMEAYALYERLGMTEVLPEARNTRAHLLDVGTPRSSDLALIRAIEAEPDETGNDEQQVQQLAGRDDRVPGLNASATSGPAAPEQTTANDDDYF